MLLKSAKQIDWTSSSPSSDLILKAIHFGHGAQPIQVAIAQSTATPTRAQLKALYQERKGRLPIFLIIAVEHGSEVSIFGPDPDTEVITQRTSTATAFLNAVLAQDNELLAYQRAVSIRRSQQTTDMVGFTNNGLFASHYIRTSINRHAKWDQAQAKSVEIQGLRDKDLIQGLGFEIATSSSSTMLLNAKDQDKRVVAILLERNEGFDSKSNRLQATPVEWSLGIAAQQGAPWVIAIKDSQLRLYPAKDGVGVGQKSQVETYFEIDLLTIDDDKTGLLDLIFSAEALAEGGTAEELLRNSRNYAAELGVRLRERVYESVVPELAKEIANQLRSKGHKLDAKGLQGAYELTLRILFRLLFQAYAEDRGLLPAGRNEIFDSNSIKHWANYLLTRDPEAAFGDSASIWFDLMQVWDAIDQGNPDMQIPAYNGGLFGTDPDLHPEGHLIRSLTISDRVMGPALQALVVDNNTEDGVAGAVDFRSLSVREFGTIYEGLLESSLSVADHDLTVDKKGAWVPASEGDQVFAKKDEVYFHSASGERKATGSYYTPSFIVDHLIERSVEPALNEHLARVKEKIDANDQAAAYKLFFDFRVADLAMGSAHFLVAAIDKIETVMRSFLILPGNQIDGVNAELIRLESAAREQLGKDEAAYAEIERSSLLRRQIARRCVYGLDINPLAVELSRLAIWIHTFVPGLPMSSLEHNLVCANSLTGIGSVDEAMRALFPKGKVSGDEFLLSMVSESLGEARELLEDVAQTDEADKRQSKNAAAMVRVARNKAYKAKMIFDLAVACRNGVASSGAVVTESDLLELHSLETVTELIEAVRPAHMPYLFPEVFMREDPGFNAVVGNPPWEEVVFDEVDFWTKIRPGLKALDREQLTAAVQRLRLDRADLLLEIETIRNQTQLLSSVLNKAGFPGMTTGNPDLYKAFTWKFWGSTRASGAMGIVLPRTVLSGQGMRAWRNEAFSSMSHIEAVVLRNTRNWVFGSVGAVQSFAVMSIRRSVAEPGLWVSGTWNSFQSWTEKRDKWLEVNLETLRAISSELAVPDFDSPETFDIFVKMSHNPKLAEWRGGGFRPMQGDFNQTTASNLWNPVHAGDLTVIKGNGVSIWGSCSEKAFASAHSDQIIPILMAKRSRQQSTKSSSYFGIEIEKAEDLEIYNSRIAFRDVVRATDSRTLISALVPPGTVLTNKAPYLVNRARDSRLEAYVLGLFSSFIVDWYVRRKVELSLNFHTLNEIPIPEVSEKSEEFIGFLQLVLLCLQDKDVHRNWIDSLGLPTSSESVGNPNAVTQSRIDAQVAIWFGLEPTEVQHIATTFKGDKGVTDRLPEVLMLMRERE